MKFLKNIVTAISLLALSQNAFADNSTKKINMPPPPPPPPVDSEVFTKEIQGNNQQQPKVEEITDVYAIPEHIWKDILNRRDALTPYLQDFKNVKILPYEKRVINKTNILAYTPSLSLLIQFPFDIKTVIYGDFASTTPGGKQSAKAVFDKNLLLIYPPPPTVNVWNFVVVAQNDEAYYFICEKSKTTDKDIKNIVPYLTFVYPTQITDKEIISQFYKQNKRCPFHGEYFVINSRSYRFLVKEQNSLNKNIINFCGKYYQIEALK